MRRAREKTHAAPVAPLRMDYPRCRDIGGLPMTCQSMRAVKIADI
jgi:hypothetical protein